MYTNLIPDRVEGRLGGERSKKRTYSSQEKVYKGTLINMIESTSTAENDLDHMTGSFISCAKGTQAEKARAT